MLSDAIFGCFGVDQLDRPAELSRRERCETVLSITLFEFFGTFFLLVQQKL